MSLRVRLIAYVAAAMVASLVFGAGLTWWSARVSVETEVGTAFVVANHTVQGALESLADATDPKAELTRVITAFDGDRHVRASLIGNNGSVRASTMAGMTEGGAPDWFVRVIGVAPMRNRLDLPAGEFGAHAILLETNPHNEVNEIWNSSRDAMAVMVVFCGLTALMIFFSLGRALRPLAALSKALGSIGSGRYDARLPEQGPAELAHLSSAFNRMAAELGTVQAQNRQLHEQLLTLQEAERAELARDLHDEVGPFLFAVGIDAAGIERAAKRGGGDEVLPLVASIREAIAHMQRHVRAILSRLRPVGLEDFGLDQAIENLVDFWRRRHPDIEFSVTLDVADGFGEVLDATIYRVVQEALSNALRHARPSRVEVEVLHDGPDIVVGIIDDGDGGEAPALGFGLTGMRERVAAAGGSLQAAPRPDGGFQVIARLGRPLVAAS